MPMPKRPKNRASGHAESEGGLKHHGDSHKVERSAGNKAQVEHRTMRAIATGRARMPVWTASDPTARCKTASKIAQPKFVAGRAGRRDGIHPLHRL